MDFFIKKNFLFKLIISICIILAIMNCSGSQKVYAATESSIGGTLLSPICDLVLGLADAIMNVLQNAIMGTDATLPLDNTKEIDWGAILLWVVVIAVVVAASIITAGGVWAALGPMLVTAAKIAAIYGAVCLATGGAAHTVVTSVVADSLSNTVILPTYNIGPEEIFSGKILLFDANIFNPKEVWVEYNIVEEKNIIDTKTVSLEEWNKTYKFTETNQPVRFYYEEDGIHETPNNTNDDIETSINNSAYELRNIISKWYYIIRTIALVGSMLILLYIGIRIIISSIAEEKAKYKQMLGDWVIALCLIFLMHYIMIFSHNIVESITKLFTSTINQGTHAATIVEPNSNLSNAVKELENIPGEYYDEDNNLIKWPTNLMGRIRVEAQKKDGSIEYVGYAIAYVVLVIYTLTFTYTYIKRLLYLLFLTVISPFVALTYPLDKIHDGKAQAFDMWLKEYIFNLLIQPFHLLLYTIFVSMAFELSSTNIIYTLVVLGFMMPAEKFLRTMFGFNKASTPGLLGGAAGAAIAMSAVNSLGKFASKGGHGEKRLEGKEHGKEEKTKIRTPDSKHSMSDLFGNVAKEGNDENQPQKNALASNNLESEKARQQEMVNANNRNIVSGNNIENTDLESEKARLASERSVLEEFEEEGALSDDWDKDDYDAYQELEREQLEQEEKLRQQEMANAQPNVKIRQEPVIKPPVSTNDTTADSQSSDSKKKKSYAGRKFKAGAKMVGKAAASGIVNTANFGAKAALGIAGGMIGAAAGIASGDPNKVFQNTTIGAGAGATIASGIGNSVKGSSRDIEKIKTKVDEFNKDVYGAEYSQYMRDKMDDEFWKDKKIRKMYKEQLGLKNKEEVDLAMNDALKYREYGINDNSIIVKAMKAEKGNPQNRADNRRIAAAKLAEISKNEKDLQTHMQRFAKTPGMSDKQVENMERMVREINNL